MKNSMFSDFRLGALFLLSLLFLVGCSKDPLEKEEEQSLDLTAKNVKDTTLIEGQYIVILSTLPGKKNPRALAALEALSKEVGQMPEAKISRKYSHALTGFAAELTDKQVEKLKKDPRVEAIEQDSYIYLTGEPAVQEYPTWGLDRIDQRENKLDRAYSYEASGSDVTVYIVDSGIRFSHNEFGGRASLGYDFVREDDPGNTDPSQGPGEDCMGHGTHVAGIVGGFTKGVAKNVNLVSVRVFGCTTEAPKSRYIAAIEWITSKAVHPAVVNMSLSFTDDPENQTLTDAAVMNSIEAGLNFTVSAGNNKSDACNNSPARVPTAITVGASDIENNRAYISNFGSCVDLYAPGVSIYSASNLSDGLFTKMDGTSMSAPYVAGVVALLLEKNPGLSPAEIHAAVVDNSTPNVISDVPSGTNNLLYSHTEPFEFTPPPPPDLMLKATGVKEGRYYYANLTWKFTESPKINLYIDGILQWVEHSNDGEHKIKLPLKGKDATYIIQICEKSYNNCSEEIVLSFGEGSGEPVNESPVAGFEYSASLLNVQFSDTSIDPDGTIVAWDWDFGDGNVSSEQNPYYSFAQEGSFTVKLTVTDDGGSSSSILKSLIIGNQEPPPAQYELTAEGSKDKGKWKTLLTWSGIPGENIDIYRNGKFFNTIPNWDYYWDLTDFKGSGSLIYKICESGTNSCSNEVTVQF